MLPQVTVSPTPPTPPSPPVIASPQQGDRSDFGRAIEGMVNDAVSGVLAQTRTQLQERVVQLEAEQARLERALHSAPAAAQPALQRELARVTSELARTRAGIERIEAQLSTRGGPQGTVATTAPPDIPFPVNKFDPTPVVATTLGILFVAFPLTLALVRFLWKRATNAPPPAMTVEQQRRFDRLEQSVDAIAIEIERISENQRYLTKLLAEQPRKQGIGSGT